MAASRRPPYEYLELGEACARQGYQNVYALVAEFSVPRLTRGTGGEHGAVARSPLRPPGAVRGAACSPTAWPLRPARRLCVQPGAGGPGGGDAAAGGHGVLCAAGLAAAARAKAG